MKRRDFLKVSGAALVATQLPLGQEKEQKFSEGPDGTRYYELDVSQKVEQPVRRRAIFLYDEKKLPKHTRLKPPPLGTIVMSSNQQDLFQVVEHVDVPVIDHVTSHWDRGSLRPDAKVGAVYNGYVMIVEALPPADGRYFLSNHRECDIRHILTETNGYSIVCENWRVEKYGGDPNHFVLALDATCPEQIEMAVRANLMPVKKV